MRLSRHPPARYGSARKAHDMHSPLTRQRRPAHAPPNAVVTSEEGSMKRVNLVATACFTAVLGYMTTGAAAQDLNVNKRTYLTFSSAVELPDVTLQPGTYLFRLADSQTNRHIIQVLSRDEKQIYATILAVPAERLPPSAA